MAQQRKGGLGRGLAALIPSAPASTDTTGKTGAIGNNASDIIFGDNAGARDRRNAEQEQSAQDKNDKGAPKKKVKGAPTVGGTSRGPVKGAPTVTAAKDNVMQPVPVGARYQEVPLGQILSLIHI